MYNLAILVSGNGTNLQYIIDKIGTGDIKAKIEIVISDKSSAYAIERANKNGIKTLILEKKNLKNNLSNEILKNVKNCNLIVLAGFLSILKGEIIEVFKNRIINIHPSLIPSFCGKGMYGIKVHEAAINRGVKVSGCTVHIVDKGTDTGTILKQKTVTVNENDTPENLAEKIHVLEHKALEEVINEYVNGKIDPEIFKR